MDSITDSGKAYSVYLIGPREQAYKIGYSDNVQRRLNEAQTFVPHVRIADSISCKDQDAARELESHLHTFFEFYKEQREWFHISPRQFRDAVEQFRTDKQDNVICSGLTEMPDNAVYAALRLLGMAGDEKQLVERLLTSYEKQRHPIWSDGGTLTEKARMELRAIFERAGCDFVIGRDGIRMRMRPFVSHVDGNPNIGFFHINERLHEGSWDKVIFYWSLIDETKLTEFGCALLSAGRRHLYHSTGLYAGGPKRVLEIIHLLDAATKHCPGKVYCLKNTQAFLGGLRGEQGLDRILHEPVEVVSHPSELFKVFEDPYASCRYGEGIDAWTTIYSELNQYLPAQWR